MLQTRNAKRPAQAAVRFACDAVDEGLLTREQALATIDAGALDALLHPTFDPTPTSTCSREASRASPGAAKGEIVFTAADAVEAAGEGRDVILVRPSPRPTTSPASTRRAASSPPRAARPRTRRWSRAAWAGRRSSAPTRCDRPRARARSTSTATVVQRGRPDRDRRHARRVTTDDVPLFEPEVDEQFERVLDLVRRACARSAFARTPTTPSDARRARELGAEGIGLCRTEHMFSAPTACPRCAR